jgi:hypothetical protein
MDHIGVPEHFLYAGGKDYNRPEGWIALQVYLPPTGHRPDIKHPYPLIRFCALAK